MRIEAGRTQYVEGNRLSVELNPVLPGAIPGETATHEAMHVIAAYENGTGVESATIIPGAGYLGLTRLKRFDAVSAMAPHSMGKSGTSHDVYIASLFANAGAAESAARGIINSNMDKVAAVASSLEEKKTITGSDIDRVINEVKNPKPQIATLFIESQDGRQVKEKVEVRDNIVIVPEQLIEVFSAKQHIH